MMDADMNSYGYDDGRGYMVSYEGYDHRIKKQQLFDAVLDKCSKHDDIELLWMVLVECQDTMLLYACLKEPVDRVGSLFDVRLSVSGRFVNVRSNPTCMSDSSLEVMDDLVAGDPDGILLYNIDLQELAWLMLPAHVRLLLYGDSADVFESSASIYKNVMAFFSDDWRYQCIVDHDAKRMIPYIPKGIDTDEHQDHLDDPDAHGHDEDVIEHETVM